MLKSIGIFLAVLIGAYNFELASCQSASEINAQIDSLENLTKELEKQLQTINEEIFDLKNKKELLEIQSIEGKKVSAIIRSNNHLLAEPSNISKKIIAIPAGSEVELLDYQDTFYKVVYNDKIGFVWELYIQNHELIDTFKKSKIELFPKKEKQRIWARNGFIQIKGDKINIRSAPNKNSSIVAQALKGDIFECKEESNGWYKIIVLSGEYRYVYKSLAKFLGEYTATLPSTESERREIFNALLKAEDRAQAEADRKYPLAGKFGKPIKANLKKNANYASLLRDKYELEVVHKYKIQPPASLDLTIEAAQKNWY